MDQFDNTVKNYMSVFDNQYVSAVLAIILIAYAGIAAPRLPESIANLFDYAIVKLVIFFLIAYMAQKNATVAIIAAVGVLISLMTLSTYKFNRELMTIVGNSDNLAKVTGTDDPSCNCGVYGCACNCKFSGNTCECGCNNNEEAVYENFTENDSSSVIGYEEGSQYSDIEMALPESGSPPPAVLCGDRMPTVGDRMDYKNGKKQGIKNFDNASMVSREEEKVGVVLGAIDKLKKTFKRDLSKDEVVGLCSKVNTRYSNEKVKELNSETLSMLRAGVEERKQDTEFTGYDTLPMFAPTN